MRRSRLFAVSIAVLISCNGEKNKEAPTPKPPPEPPRPTLKTERVECFIAPGAMGAGGRMDIGRRGPDFCLDALVAFLATNAARHVVAIIPVEFPVDPPDTREYRYPGTQELLVTTANIGTWPVASELEVSSIPCLERHEDQPTKFDASACLRTVREFGDTIEKTPLFWVSLAGKAIDTDPTHNDVRPSTVKLLHVSRRTR